MIIPDTIQASNERGGSKRIDESVFGRGRSEMIGSQVVVRVRNSGQARGTVYDGHEPQFARTFPESVN